MLPVLASAGFATGFIAILCILFDPAWETNDDVAMSMVAHGYGIAAHGTPVLIFSNAVWGTIVRSLPQIGGLLGYSLATLGCLALAGTTIILALRKCGAGAPIALLTMVIVLSRATLFPQFTVNAGLLTIAAVATLLASHPSSFRVSFAAACMFATLGFLVRNIECALILVVAIPVLPWRQLGDRGVQIILGATGLFLCGAVVYNEWAMTGPEWTYFWDLNWPRAMFTDFGAGNALLARPDVMARHGLSENDVKLVSNWFFVDREIASPARLRAVLDDMSFRVGTTFNLVLARAALLSFLTPVMLPIGACAGCLLLLVRSVRPWLVGLLCVLVIFTLGGLGRAHVFRIFLPLILLVIVVAISDVVVHRDWRRYVSAIVLLGAIFWNGINLHREIQGSSQAIASARSTKFYSPDVTVVWGGALLYEYVFPVLSYVPDTRDTRISGLGTFTFAPFSVGYQEENSENNFLKRLQRREGVSLMIPESMVPMLDTYCREHLGVPLKMSILEQRPIWTIFNVSCSKS